MIFSFLFSATSSLYDEGFESFYNYRFEEAAHWLQQSAKNSDSPYIFNMFITYNEIRRCLANAKYETASRNADSLISKFEPDFKTYLKEYPEDVDVRFYYAAMLGGKMRVYLHDMSYFKIMSEGPPILLAKTRIDKYTNEYPDIAFGTGSFNYYLSQFAKVRGLTGGLFNTTKENGINDLWKAYYEGKLVKWEASIVLIYITIYDRVDFNVADELCRKFLDRYPDNMEVLSLYTELNYYQKNYKEAKKYYQHLEDLTYGGRLEDNSGYVSKCLYLKGVEQMVRGNSRKAMRQFRLLLIDNNIEYSWYHAITLKYLGDCAYNLNETDLARYYYRQTVNTRELIPHVLQARDILNEIK